VITYKGINIMKKEWLEAVLADTIGSIKASLDEVYRNDQLKFKSQLEQIKATYFISKIEITQAVEMIKDQHEATLTPRHRDVIEVFKHFEKKISDDFYNPLYAKNMGNQRIIRFVKETIKFLEVAHTTLHCDTDKKIRQELTNSYTGD
jgi:hypothetical protein